MNTIELYCQARISIEHKFRGLPYAHTLLVNHLIGRANPFNGTVSKISYNDIALLLTINKAPGRKESGTPTKQTIRNYIKSIERECGDHFKVISEGQSLKFLFPQLPKIFSEFLKNTEGNTELNSPDSLMGFGAEGNLDVQDNREVNTEANTPKSAVKNINIFNITKTNKLTNTPTSRFCHSKKPIDDNFYPNTATIELALSMGLNKVLDQDEINAFIQHNKNHNTQWADFNPIFVTWLERDAQYIKNKQQKAQKPSRSDKNERNSNQNSLYPEALRRVSELHGISIESIWGNQSSEHSTSALIEGTVIQPMDTTDCNLRDTFHL
ncbi:hypothetical protein BN59_03708 [Legionella massiliensis]|uniref:Uncharacterized protein n=1 Tax=Legionella massiliensis TaxID=1034943 RepID=A0A078KYB7_9GAMM|nr:Vir protein [Legionella massiliensis]CDZ79390.1 hypothetical protein BN59_03708 [Legionella massiliensis]CEE15128.1 hypothetical protein BN1094_03708 [Legionella massiliensis]